MSRCVVPSWSSASMNTPTCKCWITQKKLTPEMDMIFSIYMTYEMTQWKNFKKVCGDSQQNWGQRRPLGQKVRIWSNKKILLYQFFKTRIWAFMTYGQFLPKNGSNFRSVIRNSRIWDPRLRPAKASNPWISYNRSQIWATFWQKLIIGHKSTYYSFEKLWENWSRSKEATLSKSENLVKR